MNAFRHEFTWSDFKTLALDTKGLAFTYVEETHPNGSTWYQVFTVDGPMEYFCTIKKEGTAPDPSDQKEFEDNYKAKGNKPHEVKMHPFAGSDVDGAFNGAFGTATKNTTTNFDLQITTNTYLSGGEMITDSNAILGDWMKCQIVDIDDVLGYGPNTVLKQWVNAFYCDPGRRIAVQTNYAGLIPANTYIRAIYNSTGTVNDVKVAFNYYLHTPI